jgi:hypothetical protein
MLDKCKKCGEEWEPGHFCGNVITEEEKLQHDLDTANQRIAELEGRLGDAVKLAERTRIVIVAFTNGTLVDDPDLFDDLNGFIWE